MFVAFVRLAILLMAAISLLPWQPAQGAGEPPIRIGVSLGLSGSYEQIGGLQQRAYKLWQRHVNERGGILGRPVQVVVVDDQSDPDVAREIYKGFIERDHLDFVFAPYSSVLTMAIAPLVDQHGYPTLVAGASADDLWAHGYQNLFGIYSPAGRYAIGFLAVLAEAGIERIAIVSAADTFSVDAANGIRRWAPHYGLRITSSAPLPPDRRDMAGVARAARDAGAQAVLVTGHFNESIAVRRALHDIGWTPSAYYATVGPAVEKYGTALGTIADGSFSTSIWEPREDLHLTDSADFLRQFVAAYGERPSYQAATAYAAGQILEQAIRKSGSTDRAMVRHTLQLIDADSIIGRYAVDRTGMQIKRFPLIIQWQGSRREIVWPPELRTTPPAIRR